MLGEFVHHWIISLSHTHMRTHAHTRLVTIFIDAKQLAYETMFQDDVMLPTQSMPWWDPGYLANSEVSIQHITVVLTSVMVRNICFIIAVLPCLVL